MIKENHAGSLEHVNKSPSHRILDHFSGICGGHPARNILASQNLDGDTRPWKLTAGTQSHEGWKIVFLFKQVIFRFRVSFREGKPAANL